MKKLIAIFFVGLVLFNALGFYGLLVGLQYKTGLEMVERLDRGQYHPGETLTLRVPMALPYHIDTENYDRVDGQIEHRGEFYRLVKQKLEKDTLYIVCIKDNESKLIKQALSDYTKTFTDKPADSKQNSTNLKTFIKDFLPSTIAISHASTGWDHIVPRAWSNETFKSVVLTIFSPPPQS